MKDLKNFVALLSIGLLSGADAVNYCQQNNIPQWQCDVCGGEISSTGPVQCSPFNATFDELKAGQPVGIYKSAKWQGFTVVAGGSSPLPHVEPYSKPNDASVGAGKFGIVTVGYSDGVAPGPPAQYPFGNLYSFHYACTVRNSSALAPQAVPGDCKITVKAQCKPTGDLINGQTKEFDYDVTYIPNMNNSMSFHQGDPARDAGYACSNYTFSAVDLLNLPVPDLLVDSVLYRTLRNR
ncbi:hypothetical protein AC579_4500 [Pseudocercospora musae]|uniref:Uncharacterized protein n=1 Tax=Pseudocercospora musae TaxID=113226 RepID=A0A139ID78_9PEZI|nr:hypothetical protein AC579_4500 [Pseudocercospora musae]